MISRCKWWMPVLAVMLCGGGCGDDPVEMVMENQPPIVIISADPVRDAINGAIATFSWIADDADGEVVLFRYAVDDTVGAETWFETEEYELTLAFSAPDSSHIDSVFVGQSTEPLVRYIFNGAHTFFLRAIDNGGAESPPVAKAFTAESVAPETEILTPHPGGIGGIVSVDRNLRVTWAGVDPDDIDDPIGYSWRLIQVTNTFSMTDEEVEAALFDPASNGDPWTDFAHVTDVQLTLDVAPGIFRHYLFAVRALDGAGAVEPRIRTFRSPAPTNTILVRAADGLARLRLLLSSVTKSTRYPTGDQLRKTFDVAANTGVLFTWEGETDHYGGQIAGYSYGVDLEDLSEENPAWAPESPDLTQATIRFDIPAGSDPERHFLYVRARDTYGNMLIAEAILNVTPFGFERDVLYIDDWGEDYRGRTYPELGAPCISESAGGLIPDDRVSESSSTPHDSCHDQVLRETIEATLQSLGRDDWVVDRYEPLDPFTSHALLEELEIDSTSNDHWVYTGPLSLEQLSRYELVIWNTRSSANNAYQLIHSDYARNVLAIYLSAGGNVWLMGNGVFSRSLGNTSPGLSVFGFETGEFTERMLKIRSVFEQGDCVEGCFRQAGSTAVYQRNNGFEGAYTSSRASAEGYPELRVSRAPFANNPVKGIGGGDAMVPPYGLDINGELALTGGRLDTLYFYQSNLRLEVYPPGTSWMDDGAVAMRYRGPDQGNLMMFGFPLFYLPDDQIDAVMTAGIRWLLEE